MQSELEKSSLELEAKEQQMEGLQTINREKTAAQLALRDKLSSVQQVMLSCKGYTSQIRCQRWIYRVDVGNLFSGFL